MHHGEENQRQGGGKSKATQLYTPLHTYECNLQTNKYHGGRGCGKGGAVADMRIFEIFLLSLMHDGQMDGPTAD